MAIPINTSTNKEFSMNITINTLLSHCSIRKFSQQAISTEVLEKILDCAIAASSSSFIQCSSIIRITDKEKRSVLAELAGNQSYVETAAEFLVFCADYNRHNEVVTNAQLGFTEQTLISSIDTALMGQNTLIAAESLGLGGVFIGGIRNDVQAVSELLSTPKHVLPLFGLCLGYPAHQPEVKPRLPRSIVIHENNYQTLDKAQLHNYDETMKAYYASRSSNNKATTWSTQIEKILTKESRPHMQEFMKNKGFNIK
jgi:nitroreductase